MGPYSQALGVPWDVLGDGLQPRAVAIHRGASAGAEGGARRGTQAPRGCPQQQPQLGPDEPRRGPPPGRQRHGALTESLLRARRRQPLTIPVWGGLQVQHRGRAAEETAGLYAAPLRAGWHLAPPSDGACARTEGGRLGRRALGSSPVSRWLRLPPSSSQLTAARRKMGRPRARTHPAHTHTHTHTLTYTRSHPHARSHQAVIHQSKSTHPEPDSSPPSPRTPSPPPPPNDHSAASPKQRTVSKVEPPRRGQGLWGGQPTVQPVRSRPSPALHTHTHTHTPDAHTYSEVGRGGVLFCHLDPFPQATDTLSQRAEMALQTPPALLFQCLVRGSPEPQVTSPGHLPHLA